MELFSIEALINLLTLTGLEIILGIDNVIFIAILVQPLESKIRNKIRFFGLSLAVIARIVMLFGASWIMQLTKPLFKLFEFDFTGRSILLIIGGLFLVVKSILEIKEMFSNVTHNEISKESNNKSKFSIIYQIIFIDIILSFDSIITAVGLSNNLTIMICAVLISMIIMLISSNLVSKFIYANPSIKVLALAFIGLLGIILVLAGIDIEINKSYLYFSMFFAGLVETINIKLRAIEYQKLNK